MVINCLSHGDFQLVSSTISKSKLYLPTYTLDYYHHSTRTPHKFKDLFEIL